MADTVEVSVKGGLGNQIFCLAAGWAIASETGCDLVVNGTDVAWRGSNRNRILELDLFNWETFPNKIKFKQTRKIPDLGSIGNRISTRVLQEFYDRTKSVEKRDSPQEFEELKESARAGKILDGAFIDFSWLNIAHRSNFPSKFALKQEIEKQYDQTLDTAIHIRLGDFLQYPKIFPIPSEEYYRESIRVLETKHFDIFTDDEESARQRYPEIFMHAANIFGPKSFSGPQTFVLLSSYPKIVTSSSTFSGIAAWSISMNGGIVACPEQMIISEIRDSRPTSWLRVKK